MTLVVVLMRRSVVGLVIMGTMMSTAGYGYFGRKPTLEGLCKHTNIIVIAEPEKARDINLTLKTERGLPPEPVLSTFTLTNVKYRAIVFRVKQVLKGKLEKQELLEGLAENEELKRFSAFIVLLIETEVSSTGHWVPKYEEGTDYVLFLGPEVLEDLHTKSDVDRRWGEHLASPAMIEEIKRIVAEQDTVYLLKVKGDNVGYTIPKDSEEKKVVPTERDQANGYSTKAEYWFQGMKVGERAWWATGKLAYERAFKRGEPHGVFRGWYKDGKVWQEYHYKYGLLHGPVRTWDETGKVDLTFWIEDQNVLEAGYRQRMMMDKTLPPFEAMADQTDKEDKE